MALALRLELHQEPRKRPRLRSVDWARLFWLARREAALRILYPEHVQAGDRFPRVLVLVARWDHVRKAVLHELTLHPSRRFF